MHHVLNDEPATEDGLQRRVLARTFADLAGSCQTPLVVGVYASWGMGKTSFMRLIESELSAPRTKTVWYNAWQHDQDAAPSLSLLHALVDGLELQQEFRHALSQVALAFGSVLLQKTTSLTLDNLQKIQKVMDDESFRVRDARSNLRNYFIEVLAKARRQGVQRVIFFVDDLDRCPSATVLKTLEAIKLYFNLEGCVFFLGIDRACIEAAIDQSGAAGTKQTQYLDKLVQLPFSLPALSHATFRQFIQARLSVELMSCLPLICLGLERNPRSAKRFINDLHLRHSFASALSIRGYDARLLALLLLIEYLDPPLFARLSATPVLLLALRDDRTLAEREIVSPRLLEVLFATYIPRYASLEHYVGLTSLSMAGQQTPPHELDLPRIAAAHRQWVRSGGTQGQRAMLALAFLEKQNFERHLLAGVDFEAALLSRSTFEHADLRRAVLAGASLVGANLNHSCLRFADLREADLRDATLQQADMRGADLRHTNFRGADLSKATGLSREQIDASLLDSRTQLPVSLHMPLSTQLQRHGGIPRL